jgi:hypothetical protein
MANLRSALGEALQIRRELTLVGAATHYEEQPVMV